MTREDKSKFLLYVRKFLNKPRHQAGAYIIASVEREESTWEDKSSKKQWNLWHYYTLKISDCDRVISLDFPERERENNLAKVDTLIEILTKFRDAMVKAHAYEDQFRARHGSD